MPTWFNPRVFAVAVSILVMLSVSKVGDPIPTIRRDVLCCALMLALYAWAFLAPIARTLGPRRILWPALSLFAAWLSVAFALISDALPRTLAERMDQHFNWPMAACCLAGAAAFFLFFQTISRAFRLRDEIQQARHTRT